MSGLGGLTLLEHRRSPAEANHADTKPSLPRDILRGMAPQGDSPMKCTSTRRSQCSTEAVLTPRSMASSGGPSRSSSRPCGFADLEVPAGEWKLQTGAFQVPHPDKVAYGGEDSYFISSDGLSAGVADGVGEWGARFGLNPRDFATELMDGAQQAAEDQLCADGAVTAADLARRTLAAGFGAVKSFGAATAIVVAADPARGELGVASLGDSGLRLLRPSGGGASALQVVGRTEEQQHSFNQPFQLSKTPKPQDFPRLRAEGKGALIQAVKARGAAKADAPSDAAAYTFAVEVGDIVVMGSDGLFDNLEDDALCSIVEAEVAAAQGGDVDTQDLARIVAQEAARRSAETDVDTPFAAQARSAGMEYRGGKPDDITVLIAVVVA